MSVTGLIFLLAAHFITGAGIIRLFKLQLPAIAFACFSILIGVTISSLVPCVLELMHIPIVKSNIYIGLSVLAAITSIPLIIGAKQMSIPKFSPPKIYEMPFLIVFTFLALVSIWRCFYFPPTPRDVLTGAEVIAEYTVREHTMINSVFDIDVRLKSSANNLFKSPFMTGIQINYKLLVQPFGQLWLSVMFLSFSVWFYSTLRTIVHPFLAGVLVLIFFSIPDLFAYTYIILYDYASMVFFFGGFYYMTKYIENKQTNYLLWISFLFGLSTFIRSESMIIVFFMSVVPMLYFYKSKMPILQIAKTALLFVSGSVILFLLVNNILVKLLIPLPSDPTSLINSNLTDVSVLFKGLKDIVTELIISSRTVAVYAHFYFFFFAVVVMDVIWPRKYSRDSVIALLGVLIVFLSFGIMCYIFPFFTIINTVKRGLFKFIPIMVLYMAHSGILQKVSDYLKRKEAGISKKVTPAVAATQPKNKGKKKK